MAAPKEVLNGGRKRSLFYTNFYTNFYTKFMMQSIKDRRTGCGVFQKFVVFGEGVHPCKCVRGGGKIEAASHVQNIQR